jgi:hypothetical protein
VFLFSQNLQNPQNYFSVGESGQPARFPAATRLGAATRFSLDFTIVLTVLSVL